MGFFSRPSWMAFWLGIVPALGCSSGEQDAKPAAQAPASDQASPSVTLAAQEPALSPDGTLTHLEGRFGSPDTLWALASYKVKREGGKLTKALEIEVDNAPPAVTHALTLDGFAVGKMITKFKGEGEFSLVAAGDDYFPEGFPEPKSGSVVRIGELAELRLETLEKLTDLRADIAGPGKLSGKVGFKIERLGDSVTREFQVKVTHAEEKTVHPVTLDGVHVADLSVDLAGKGKVEFSTLSGDTFPAGFPEPRPGSSIEIGRLFKGELRDNRVAHAR